MSSAPLPPLPLRPALLAALVDDAAVFPPGNSPLDAAVDEHVRRADTRLGRFVGPLLVPATSAAELVDLAAGRSLRVGLICRPGSPVEPLLDAVSLLRGRSDVVATGLEAGWSPSWQQLLDTELPVTVEIPRAGFSDALEDLTLARAEGAAVQAKFRAGATDTWAWPDEKELASFLCATLERGMPFKLTGGLHHAVRADHGSAEAAGPQHGLLNVLLAVHRARSGGDVPAVTDILAEPDAAALAGPLRALSDEQVTRVREAFTAYGCCTVTDPLGELADLGLLPA
ncbi:MAG: hypothetical protein ACOYBU_07470 [Dermatophilaceae bacterium]